MPLVDLDLDAGAAAEIYSLATVVNVACRDTAAMARAVSFALARGTRVAAQPSAPEGRSADEIARAVEQQCAALQSIARRIGFPATIVKPEAALMAAATSDAAVAAAVIDGAARGLGIADLTVVGPPKGALLDEALRRGLRYARSGLVHRLTDAIALASSGTIETLHVAAGAPSALDLAAAVRDALIQNGYLAGAV